MLKPLISSPISGISETTTCKMPILPAVFLSVLLSAMSHHHILNHPNQEEITVTKTLPEHTALLTVCDRHFDVCTSMFCKVLCISSTRINTVLKNQRIMVVCQLSINEGNIIIISRPYQLIPYNLLRTILLHFP